MSNEAERLIDAGQGAYNNYLKAGAKREDFYIVLRALVDELGISWEMVDRARLLVPAITGSDEGMLRADAARDLLFALATILSAAGVER